MFSLDALERSILPALQYNDIRMDKVQGELIIRINNRVVYSSEKHVDPDVFNTAFHLPNSTPQGREEVYMILRDMIHLSDSLLLLREQYYMITHKTEVS